MGRGEGLRPITVDDMKSFSLVLWPSPTRDKTLLLLIQFDETTNFSTIEVLVGVPNHVSMSCVPVLSRTKQRVSR